MPAALVRAFSKALKRSTQLLRSKATITATMVE